MEPAISVTHWYHVLANINSYRQQQMMSSVSIKLKSRFYSSAYSFLNNQVSTDQASYQSKSATGWSSDRNPRTIARHLLHILLANLIWNVLFKLVQQTYSCCCCLYKPHLHLSSSISCHLCHLCLNQVHDHYHWWLPCFYVDLLIFSGRV